MAFLRALLDVVNDVPHVAMLVVMIASDRDKTALSAAPRTAATNSIRLLERNGTPATVTEVGDFADILRRRLFDAEPAAEVLAATAAMYRPVLDDRAWTKNVWDAIGANWRDQLGRGGRGLLPVPPYAYGDRQGGVEQGHRLPACPVHHPDLRRHGLRPAAARQGRRVGACANRPWRPPA